MKNRLEYLDASRGLAALSVVLCHFFSAFGVASFFNSPLKQAAFSFLWNGQAAVRYFFILSGFVLASGYFNVETKQFVDIDMKGYLVRRVFRIYPLFIVCLGVSFLLQKLYLQNIIHYLTVPQRLPDFLEVWSKPSTVFSFLNEANLFNITNQINSQDRLLPQGWTLNAELVFSSMVPIFLVIMNKGKVWVVVAFLVCISMEKTLFPFILGILVARFYSDIVKRVNGYTGFVLLAIGLLLYSCKYNFLNTYLVKGHDLRSYTLECIGSGMLLMAILVSNWLKKILQTRFLVFIGRISYSIYLSHYIILVPFIPVFLHWLNVSGYLNTTSNMLLSFVVFVTLTVILSYIFYLTIEKRFIRIGKKIVSKLTVT